MRAVAEGRLPNTSSAFSTHIDRCLGCRACEQVCPAGVEYGQLLEASRHELLRAQPRQNFTHKLLRFALRHLWSSPARLRMVFATARVFRDLGLAKLLLQIRFGKLISQRVHFGLALLENSRAQIPVSSSVVTSTTTGQRVSLFKGCVGEGLFARVNRATERVLSVNGFEADAPADQVCCGALHAHAGDLEGARKLARQNIRAFADSSDPIVTNAGGCGAMLASYGHLLDDEEAIQFSGRVRDVGQQLATGEIRQGASVGNETTTYDLSCHLLYGQHAGEASLRMLEAIPDLNFKNLEGAERCCGGAGIYNLMEPEMSSLVLDEKLLNVKLTGAGLLATGNPGCQMQIGAGACVRGMELKVCHPVEILDESYEAAGLYE
jgi:glycolate dehydrogenase iron-sulfur subunit